MEEDVMGMGTAGGLAILIYMFIAGTVYGVQERVYVTVFTQNMVGHSTNMHLYIISTRTQPVTVQVFVPCLDTAVPFKNLTLDPGQRTKVTLPANAQMPTGTRTSNRIIRVVASNDITVLALNAAAWNLDMYQVKETSQLGKKYVVVAPESYSAQSAATVGVVSPFPNTEVKVTLPDMHPTISAEVNGLPQTLSREFSIILQENQAFQIQSANELSGTYIASNKPIAVLTGVNRTKTPEGLCAGGQITQLLSLDKMGTKYIAFGLPISGTKDYINIVSTQPDTDITFDGSTTMLSNARTIARLRIERNQFKLIEISKPAVVSMTTASGISKATQGAVSNYMLHSLPLRGLIYTITVPDVMSGAHKYLVILVENDGVNDVLLDDVAISGVAWVPVTGTNISGCFYPVTENTEAKVLRHRRGKPLAVYLQCFMYCNAYSITFEANERDKVQPGITQTQVCSRDLRANPGKRKTSQRMKLLTVSPLQVCFSFCLSYAECEGVNYLLNALPMTINCELLFTETDGQEDIADWTYYQFVPN
ncbi:IgGFc-binding protein-like [Haliotis asinina]|uniref:IgGFc-binding protein-like n=1 Tax=Haliotis asinina TaxID=109174 RepID=UPI003531817B